MWCPCRHNSGLQDTEVARTPDGRFELPAIAELATLSQRSSDAGDTLLVAGVQSRAMSGTAALIAAGTARALASNSHSTNECPPQDATSLTDAPSDLLIDRESSLADAEPRGAVHNHWSDTSTLTLRWTDSQRREAERALEDDSVDRAAAVHPGGGSPDFTALLGGWRPAVSPHGGALELTMQHEPPTAADVAAAAAAAAGASFMAPAPWALSAAASHVSVPLSARTMGSVEAAGGPRHIFLEREYEQASQRGDGAAVAEGVTDGHPGGFVRRGELVGSGPGDCVGCQLDEGPPGAAWNQHTGPKPLQLEPSRPGRAYQDRSRRSSADASGRRLRDRQGSSRRT